MVCRKVVKRVNSKSSYHKEEKRNPVSDTCLTNIFSQPFILLKMSFTVEIFNFNVVQFVLFSFLDLSSGDISKAHCQT